MNDATHPSPPPSAPSPEKALTLALRLAHAESALHALTSDQVDAIVDPDGRAYLLRPAQEHLRRNERRLQAVIDSSADVLTVVDRGGVILAQSHAARPVLGYTTDELVGKSIFKCIHNDDLPQTYAAFFNVIEEFRTNATVEFRHRTRSGTYRPIEATVSRFRDVSSLSVVFSMRPVTRFQPAPHAPRWTNVPDLLPASEERQCITLSHGRQIPLAGSQFDPASSEPTPS